MIQVGKNRGESKLGPFPIKKKPGEAIAPARHDLLETSMARFMGILATPPKATPQEIAGLIKGY